MDTPELRTRDPVEKAWAVVARDELKRIALAKMCVLANVGVDKYGRLLAQVFVGDTDLSAHLVAAKLAVEYSGGKKNDVDWDRYCGSGNHKRAEV